MHDFCTRCAQAEAVTMWKLEYQVHAAKRNPEARSAPFYLPKVMLTGKALHMASAGRDARGALKCGNKSQNGSGWKGS